MSEPTTPMPFWREPMMWLVLGGPATVVVASIVTAVIAWHWPDPVLSVDAHQEPAVHARNHAAAPTRDAP